LQAALEMRTEHPREPTSLRAACQLHLVVRRPSSLPDVAGLHAPADDFRQLTFFDRSLGYQHPTRRPQAPDTRGARKELALALQRSRPACVVLPPPPILIRPLHGRA